MNTAAWRFPSAMWRSSALTERLHRLKIWLEDGRRFRRTVAELSALSDYQLDDLGIGRHQIRQVAADCSRKP